MPRKPNPRVIAVWDAYKYPEDTVVKIHRGTPFGNPFGHKEGTKALVVVESRKAAVEAFRKWLVGEDYEDLLQEQRLDLIANLPQLKGKHLACYCAPKACHGDVLLRLVNEKGGE